MEENFNKNENNTNTSKFKKDWKSAKYLVISIFSIAFIYIIVCLIFNNKKVNVKNISIEETVSYYNWEITILYLNLSHNSYDNSNKLTISLKVKNIGETSNEFLPGYIINSDDISAYLIYNSNGKEYKYSYSNGNDTWAEEELYKSIPPLGTRTGTIVFKGLPQDIFNKNGTLIFKITTCGKNNTNELICDLTNKI